MQRRNIFLALQGGKITTKMLRTLPTTLKTNYHDFELTKNRYFALSNHRQKIVVSNQSSFVKKLQKFTREGFKNLMIVSDFDRTISTGWVQSEQCQYTYEIIQKSSYVTREFEKQCDKLRKYYLPIEKSQHIPISLKQKYMEEWAVKGQDLLMQQDIYQHQLSDMIFQSNIMLRYGTYQLLQFCEINNIEFFILSAGIGNFIDVLLRDVLHCGWINMSIAGNFFIFDEETGKIKDYTKPFITASNKNQVLRYYKTFKKYTKNIIVVGDSLEDAKMADSTGCEETIKIGFFNHKQSEKVLYQEFQKNFDVVISNDGNIKFITNLLKLIDGQINLSDLQNRYYPLFEEEQQIAHIENNMLATSFQ